jgi:hypothetical protein
MLKFCEFGIKRLSLRTNNFLNLSLSATEPFPQGRKQIAQHVSPGLFASRAVQISSVVDSVGLILLVEVRLKLFLRNQVVSIPAAAGIQAATEASGWACV